MCWKFKIIFQGSKAHEAGIAPYGTSGVQYSVGDNEEGYVKLIGKEMIRAPCPANPNQWQVNHSSDWMQFQVY